MYKKVSREVGGRPLSIETGRLAKQAHGAAWLQYGDTQVLVTAVSDRMREGVDFLPLTVDYQEMAYAAGKIPGGFLKREGRLSDHEVLVSRLIDRPIRPLFPKDYFYEIQVIVTVMSAEMDNLPDVLALNGASAALMISDIPFDGPAAAVRVGRLDGKWVINPSEDQLEESDVNLIVAGTRDAVVMVEGGGNEIPEEEMLDGIFCGHQALQPLLDMQEELREAVGVPDREYPPLEIPDELRDRIRAMASEDMAAALKIPEKKKRHAEIAQVKEQVSKSCLESFPDHKMQMAMIMEELEYELARQVIVRERKRIDGRKFDEVRPVTCDVGLLPRVHGSGLFTRGETQVMAAATLGTAADEQRVDTLSEGESRRSFILHYRFPPFCTGETKQLRGPGRREVGHGALAARAIKPILPSSDSFPYTIRMVTEVLESNGSSSMASTCGATLALMDAGVPIKDPVAGVAMGLIKEEDQVIILTDILGDEDHLGDMDFKVTGTKQGVTAIQMDIKIKGVTREIMDRAMTQAREGRLWILERMADTITAPREELSPYAPRIITFQVKPEKIRDVIGPGGRTIRKIVEETGVKIEVEDDGSVMIASTNAERTDLAIELIRQIVEEAEVGGIYTGTVKRIMDFGAFVEILPGTDGLLHISQLDHGHPRKVTDVIQEGDEVRVKVIEIDDNGKIRLSRKALLEDKGPGSREPHRRRNDGDERGRDGSQDAPRGGPGRRNDRKEQFRRRR